MNIIVFLSLFYFKNKNKNFPTFRPVIRSLSRVAQLVPNRILSAKCVDKKREAKRERDEKRICKRETARGDRC